MAQRRYSELGNDLNEDTLNIISSSLQPPGVLKGGELFINADDEIGIKPITVIFENGVILTEDTNKTVLINLTNIPAKYTIVYTYSNSENLFGGTEGIIELLEGFLNQKDMPKDETTGLADSVVIGRLDYTGNSAPLDSSMLSTPHKLSTPVEYKDDTPQQAIIGNEIESKGYFVYGANTLPEDITKTVNFDTNSGNVDLFLNNITSQIKRLDIFLPFINGERSVRKLIIEAKISTGNQVSISLRSNNKIILPSNGVLPATNNFVLSEILIPSSSLPDMISLKQFLVKTSIIMEPNSSINFRYFSVSKDDNV